MAVSVKVPKEIREYEKRPFFGLTTRNMIWGGSALVLGVITYMITEPLLGDDIASYLIMLIVIPCFSCGFLEYQGMPFDKYVPILLRYYGKSQILIYENRTEGMTNKWIKEKEWEDGLSKKERKKRIKKTKKINEWE